MIKCIIVDDEAFAQKSLQLIIKKNFATKLHVVGIASSVQEALQLMRTNAIQLVFLDIDMPQENGFELLRQAPYSNFKVIFTTAYEQYALQAIKQNALDYLLKPIGTNELQLAIDKFLPSTETPSTTNFESLLNAINSDSSTARIAVAINSGFELIRVTDIVCMFAKANKTEVHLMNGTILLSTKQMGTLLDELPHAMFCRIHKSHAINLNLIKKYNRVTGNVIMVTGQELFISVKEKKNFLNLFK